MKNTTESVSKKVVLAAAGTAGAVAVVAAGAVAAGAIENGLTESATIRVAEADLCAPGQNGEASFAGCSSII